MIILKKARKRLTFNVKIKEMKKFERWKYEEIELTFGTERVSNLPTLVAWLEADEPADDFEKRILRSYIEERVK